MAHSFRHLPRTAANAVVGCLSAVAATGTAVGRGGGAAAAATAVAPAQTADPCTAHVLAGRVPLAVVVVAGVTSRRWRGAAIQRLAAAPVRVSEEGEPVVIGRQVRGVVIPIDRGVVHDAAARRRRAPFATPSSATQPRGRWASASASHACGVGGGGGQTRGTGGHRRGSTAGR